LSRRGSTGYADVGQTLFRGENQAGWSSQLRVFGEIPIEPGKFSDWLARHARNSGAASSRMRIASRTLRTMRAVEPSRPLTHELVVGKSASMRAVFARFTKIAEADVPVLITGETGTGKTLLTQTLRAHRSWRGAPCQVVECASLGLTKGEETLDRLLIGAHDDAGVPRAGTAGEAARGLLVLEEIGELPSALQAQLLAVLERRTPPALAAAGNVGGGRGPAGAGAAVSAWGPRLVATTRRDLPALVAAGSFNKGLYYSLDVVTLSLPPLRERPDDIPALARSLLRRAMRRYPRTTVESLSDDALEALLTHSFPGNVRELAHVLERAVLCGVGPVVGRAELPREFQTPSAGVTRLDKRDKEK
jgi:DNA-binding NtrC family response regulator